MAITKCNDWLVITSIISQDEQLQPFILPILCSRGVIGCYIFPFGQRFKRTLGHKSSAAPRYKHMLKNSKMLPSCTRTAMRGGLWRVSHGFPKTAERLSWLESVVLRLEMMEDEAPPVAVKIGPECWRVEVHGKRRIWRIGGATKMTWFRVAELYLCSARRAMWQISMYI